jgi:hypothetical protein
MATSVTQSLFGITPQSIQAQRDADMQQQALAFARLSPMESARMGLFQGVNQLGNAFGQLTGVEDPEIAQARQRQGMLGGLDVSDPNALRQAAKNADPQTASLLVTRAMELEKGSADIEAAQALTAQRNREVAAKTSAFGQQLVDAGFTPGTPEYVAQMRRYVENELKPSKSIGEQLAEGLTPLVGAMAKSQSQKAAEAGGTAVGKDVAAIQGKEDALISLKNASKLLKDDKGNYQIYSGFYGPAVTSITKATGGFVGDRGKVVQTEKFLNEVKTTVIPLLAEFGGNDSNEELRFLQGIVGGDQTLEPEAIDAILKSAQAKIDRGIKRTQAQQKAVLEGQPLPTGSATLPRATKRFNPQTGRIETIKD